MRIKALLSWLVLAVLVLTGCKRGSEHGHSHGDGEHQHEEKTAQITVWTNELEIFAEHEGPVAGKLATFVTHVTNLETSEPRREGPIKFVLQQAGGVPIEHVQASPSRPGIYLPGLTFAKTGSWQVQVIVDGRTANLGNVEVFADEHSAAHAEFPEPPEGIAFLKEQQWKIRTKAEPVGRRPLVQRVRVPGMVQPKPGLRASVSAPIAARLLAADGKTLPLIGERVEAGQVLALLQPSFSEIAARMVEADAEVIRTQLAVQHAEANLKRVETLAKAEARTAREVQEAEFAFRTAAANHKAAQALQATYRNVTSGLGAVTNALQPMLELKAPIGGTIVDQAGAALGEYVPAERGLFIILDASSVFIEGRVPEAEVHRVSNTRGAAYEKISEPTRVRAITGDGGGRLVYDGRGQIDVPSRTIRIVYELPNAEHKLRVGEAVTVHIETAHSENAVAVPESAIVEEDGESVVFVQLAGETFDKRTVKLGIRDGEFVQVLEGLQEGERVVTQGAYAIRLASASGAIPAHGHAH